MERREDARDEDAKEEVQDRVLLLVEWHPAKVGETCVVENDCAEPGLSCSERHQGLADDYEEVYDEEREQGTCLGMPLCDY